MPDAQAPLTAPRDAAQAVTPANILREPLRQHAARLSPAWRQALADVIDASGFDALDAFLETRLAAGALVYPERPFRALDLTEPDAVRVVILGQDPYHGPGQAQGLAFSVPDTTRRPPSLRNIFLEIASEHGHDPASYSNDLTRWATQGVLLLNTLLTVEDGKPTSHARCGWEDITDAIITRVAQHPTPKVFMLWGAHAQSKQALIPADAGHLILTANHPSPLSARRPPKPFLGCGHFAQANAWLTRQGLPAPTWADTQPANSLF